ncbi:HNH endonuclease [Ensifer sp. ENS04]|uniref:HNH endonuclease n=1 Tax=Ensifer sp. ENS04 TaxID=2769281 RepID=UPI00177CA6A1|nr:HNH endonuclease [Ensifer sp. ENS04]MBD9541434.1 HNH endonuclease [Ensifer sp. ENS04]
MASTVLHAVDDADTILAAMQTWRNSFVEIGTNVGSTDVYHVPDLNIWLKTGGWHLEDKQFYSVLGVSNGPFGFNEQIVEINPARSGGPGLNRGLVARDARGVLWLLRTGDIRTGDGDLSLDLLDLRRETKVDVNLPNGMRRTYYKVARLDAPAREIAWQTKRFVAWCARLRDEPRPGHIANVPDPFAGVHFFRLNIKPQGIDKVLDVIRQDEIAIGWSRAAALIDPAVGIEDFAAIVDGAYAGKIHAGKGAGELRRFLREIKVGDAVLVPHLSGVYIGRVVGEPIYHPELLDHDTAFRRAVTWLNGGLPYEKVCFSPDLVASINSRGTCISLEKHREQIIEVICSEWQGPSSQWTDQGDDEGPAPSYALTQTRPEQIQFRNRLMKLYNARCCLTQTSIVAVLQAAHISPHYKGGRGVNHTDNGLLLRSDIHDLFDRKLLSIDPSALTVHLAPVVARSPEYAHLQGKKVHLHACPSRLADHFELARPFLKLNAI